MAIRYEVPGDWIRYDRLAIVSDLVEAWSSLKALLAVPFQRDRVERLQQVQLKREAAGTSRIEGADFTEAELDQALDQHRGIADLATRSQRQARAAADTYRWIAALPLDRPVDLELIREVHRRIVTACDDDHCEPGGLRRADQNVTFGTPRHRGCDGGRPCVEAVNRLTQAVQHEYRAHDLLIQALTLHYHLAAMHPFLDGNGRTARAMEALMLQKAGLRDTAFIAMSNYYYDHKEQYLATLTEVRERKHDLTPFLVFGLRGISSQCQRLLSEIRKNMDRVLFRATASDLFQRLQSQRKRVVGRRQMRILELLLEVDEMAMGELLEKTTVLYGDVKKARSARSRDLAGLEELGAIDIKRTGSDQWTLSVRLDWPARITESTFFSTIRRMPKSKTPR